MITMISAINITWAALSGRSVSAEKDNVLRRNAPFLPKSAAGNTKRQRPTGGKFFDQSSVVFPCSGIIGSVTTTSDGLTADDFSRSPSCCRKLSAMERAIAGCACGLALDKHLGNFFNHDCSAVSAAAVAETPPDTRKVNQTSCSGRRLRDIIKIICFLPPFLIQWSRPAGLPPTDRCHLTGF